MSVFRRLKFIGYLTAIQMPVTIIPSRTSLCSIPGACVIRPREKTYAGIIKQIDKYWKKLFADPIPIQTPQGTITVQPQRTNNILERFFRDEKRRGRKKTGTASLNRMLKSVLANTPLVQNLKNEEYLKIILNGCSSLEERFSQIDARMVQKEMASSTQNKDKILPAIKKMIKDVKFTEKISKLFCPC